MRIKRLQKKKYHKKESPLIRFNHEISGILIICAGILFTLAQFSGFDSNIIQVFGRNLKYIFTGLFSYSAYVLPLIVIIYGLFVLLRKNGPEFNTRVLYLLFFCTVFSGIIHTLMMWDSRDTYFSFKTMMQFFASAAGQDVNENLTGVSFHRSGGMIGGLVAVPFIKLFGNVGTAIILFTLAMIFFIQITNMSILGFLKSIKTLISKLFQRKPAEQRIMDIEDMEHREEKEARISREGTILSAGVTGDDELTFDFEGKSKVIDYNIEKASRELKAKADELKRKRTKFDEYDGESVELIASDFNTNKSGTRGGEPGVTRSGSTHKEINHESKKNYFFPPINLLNENTAAGKSRTGKVTSTSDTARKLEETLASFGVDARVVNVSRGPVITRYELTPSAGVKVSKIVNLADDIALNLAASGVRIEAPIPGKAAVGIEVPNKEVTPVYLREVIDSDEFKSHSSRLSFAIGKDISGEIVVADIAKMPHLLIAGATGSGKSVCINALITSILYKAHPDEVKLLMVDPKVVELGIYNGIPHLLIPVVTDPRKAAGALNWAVQEMIGRYKLFAEKGVRDIKGYNASLKNSGETGILPQMVIIIDELADLMMVASGEVEDAICRLAQMARAAGMHLVIATQRPSVDVITGVIKANIPSRISFAVSSQIDSRTILDMAGAEKLLGKGDMLYFPTGHPKPVRLQGAFVSDIEVEEVVEYIKSRASSQYNEDIVDEINNEKNNREDDPGDRDELLAQAIELVVETGQASTSLIQRRFKVGYARAGRIVDQMQERGIIGGFEGSKPRQVLISKQQWQEMSMREDK